MGTFDTLSQLADGRAWQALAPVVILTGMTVLVFLRRCRAHGAKRLKAAMDAFAEREIALGQRRKAVRYRLPRK